jgi:hypothetical protein
MKQLFQYSALSMLLAITFANCSNNAGAAGTITSNATENFAHVLAHVDLYTYETNADLSKVKLVFTPLAGSNTSSFERNIEEVTGTFMAKGIPFGKYKVKAVYAGKTLYLDNRHDNGDPAIEKEVVFGKYGMLYKTEYNCEFRISE